jgi:DNA repair exonuclease SbcCD ATPase subunit
MAVDPRLELARRIAAQGGSAYGASGNSLKQQAAANYAAYSSKKKTGSADSGGPGGWKGLIAGALESPLGKAITKPLEVLDLGRAGIVSGIKELADLVDMNENTKASWNDFVGQTQRHIGFGDILAESGGLGNKWLDRIAGFAGDVVTDPLTYLTLGGSAVAGVTGRAASSAAIARQGVQNVARGRITKEALDDIITRAGKYGVGDLTSAERTMFGFSQPGIYFNNKYRLVGGKTGENISRKLARGRARITGSGPVQKLVTTRDGLLRSAPQGLEEAITKLATGRGAISATQAATFIASNNERAAVGGAFAGTWSAVGRELGKSIDGNEEAIAITRALESGADPNNIKAATFRKFFDDVRESFKLSTGEEIGYLDNYVPHIWSRSGRRLLAGDEELARDLGATMFATVDDVTQSPFAQARRIKAGKYKILGKEVIFKTGTAEDINATLRRAFPDRITEDVLETDIRRIADAYVQGMGKGVGDKALVETLKKMGVGIDDKEAFKFVKDIAGTKEANRAAAAEMKELLDGTADALKSLETSAKQSITLATKSLKDLLAVRLSNQKKVFQDLVQRSDNIFSQMSSDALSVDAKISALHAEQLDLSDAIKLNENIRIAKITKLNNDIAKHGEDMRALRKDRLAIRRELMNEVEDVKARSNQLNATLDTYNDMAETLQKLKDDVDKKVNMGKKFESKLPEAAKQAMGKSTIKQQQQLDAVSTGRPAEEVTQVVRIGTQGDESFGLAKRLRLDGESTGYLLRRSIDNAGLILPDDVMEEVTRIKDLIYDSVARGGVVPEQKLNRALQNVQRFEADVIKKQNALNGKRGRNLSASTIRKAENDLYNAQKRLENAQKIYKDLTEGVDGSVVRGEFRFQPEIPDSNTKQFLDEARQELNSLRGQLENITTPQIRQIDSGVRSLTAMRETAGPNLQRIDDEIRRLGLIKERAVREETARINRLIQEAESNVKRLGAISRAYDGPIELTEREIREQVRNQAQRQLKSDLARVSQATYDAVFAETGLESAANDARNVFEKLAKALETNARTLNDEGAARAYQYAAQEQLNQAVQKARTSIDFGRRMRIIDAEMAKTNKKLTKVEREVLEDSVMIEVIESQNRSLSNRIKTINEQIQNYRVSSGKAVERDTALGLAIARGEEQAVATWGQLREYLNDLNDVWQEYAALTKASRTKTAGLYSSVGEMVADNRSIEQILSEFKNQGLTMISGRTARRDIDKVFINTRNEIQQNIALLITGGDPVAAKNYIQSGRLKNLIQRTRITGEDFSTAKGLKGEIQPTKKGVQYGPESANAWVEEIQRVAIEAAQKESGISFAGGAKETGKMILAEKAAKTQIQELENLRSYNLRLVNGLKSRPRVSATTKEVQDSVRRMLEQAESYDALAAAERAAKRPKSAKRAQDIGQSFRNAASQMREFGVPPQGRRVSARNIIDGTSGVQEARSLTREFTKLNSEIVALEKQMDAIYSEGALATAVAGMPGGRGKTVLSRAKDYLKVLDERLAQTAETKSEIATMKPIKQRLAGLDDQLKTARANLDAARTKRNDILSRGKRFTKKQQQDLENLQNTVRDLETQRGAVRDELSLNSESRKNVIADRAKLELEKKNLEDAMERYIPLEDRVASAANTLKTKTDELKAVSKRSQAELEMEASIEKLKAQTRVAPYEVNPDALIAAGDLAQTQVLIGGIRETYDASVAAARNSLDEIERSKASIESWIPAVEQVLKDIPKLKKKGNYENINEVFEWIEESYKLIDPDGLTQRIAGLPNDMTPEIIQDTSMLYGMGMKMSDIVAAINSLPTPESRTSLSLAMRAHEDAAKLMALSAERAPLEEAIKTAKAGEFVTVMQRALIDGFQEIGNTGVYAAEEMAPLFQRVLEIKPKDAQGIVQAINKYTEIWKAIKTTSPRFHIRNALSATVMNYVAGVSTKNMLRGVDVWRAFSRNPLGWLNDIDPALRPYAKRALDAVFAAGGGQYQEIANAATRISERGLFRVSRNAGMNVEGAVRMGQALDAILPVELGGKGLGLDQAVGRIEKFHFNYSKLSNLDEQARAFVPFWIFMSRNLPLQLEQMWLSPRTYAMYNSLARNLNAGDEDDIVPEWIKEGGGFKLPFGGNLYAVPDIGYTQVQRDLEMLKNPVRVGQNLNPLLKTALEYWSGRQFYQNIPLSSEKFVPLQGASRAAEPVLALANLFGLGEGVQSSGGQRLASQKDLYAALSLIPGLQEVERYLLPSTERSEERQGLNVFNFLTGAPITTVGERQINAEKLRRQFEEQDRRSREEAIRRGAQ